MSAYSHLVMMQASATVPRTLQTAEERREAVLEAAIPHFARRGYYGTPTTDIAHDAGISQAYVFRLFPTKQELYIACLERCMGRIRLGFEHAAAPHAGDVDAVFDAMGDTYKALLSDRTMLLNQLHSYSACEEPDIRAAVQEQYGLIVDTVQRLTGADDVRVSDFFAHGMLMTVVAAMRADELDTPWARTLLAGPAADDAC